MATTVHIDDLTQDQALSWLIANDSEYDWANNQDGDLTYAVSDNLYSFGETSQSGSIRVVFELSGFRRFASVERKMPVVRKGAAG